MKCEDTAASWSSLTLIKYFKDVPEPVCGPGKVKVKPAWCGICGSDLHEYCLE